MTLIMVRDLKSKFDIWRDSYNQSCSFYNGHVYRNIENDPEQLEIWQKILLTKYNVAKTAKAEYLWSSNFYAGEPINKETVVKVKNQYETVKSELDKLKSSVKSNLESNNDSLIVQESKTAVASKTEEVQEAFNMYDIVSQAYDVMELYGSFFN